jgi:hypothetical protein
LFLLVVLGEVLSTSVENQPIEGEDGSDDSLTIFIFAIFAIDFPFIFPLLQFEHDT